MVSWGEAFTFSKSLANLRLTVNIFPKKSSDKFFTVLFFYDERLNFVNSYG